MVITPAAFAAYRHISKFLCNIFCAGSIDIYFAAFREGRICYIYISAIA
ncbi:hypothetical protein Barb4_01197 [Bacteroidales bacterium Barb4]|nr:hypothetical protein Barb4_01197 [Bacteroidales bacterium Barb4]